MATNSPQCRDRSGYLPSSDFLLTSCANCFHHLFHKHANLVAHGNWLITIEHQQLIPVALADYRNQTIRGVVCEYISSEECDRWVECCHDAERCCDNQLHVQSHASQQRLVNRSEHAVRYSKHEWCPHTWDGFACWEAAVATSSSSAACPGFLAIMPDTAGRCGLLGVDEIIWKQREHIVS